MDASPQLTSAARDGQSVASFATYPEAQKAVDRLSDGGRVFHARAPQLTR